MNRAILSTGRIVRNNRVIRSVHTVMGGSHSVRAVTAGRRGRNIRAVRAGGGEGFSGGRGDERRAFEQAAEILFARLLMFAVGELEIRRGFVTDFEPFELNNADLFAAAFPDLALLKFHGRKNRLSCFLVQER